MAYHIQAGDAGTDATANSRLISERRLCLGAKGFSLVNHIGFLLTAPFCSPLLGASHFTCYYTGLVRIKWACRYAVYSLHLNMSKCQLAPSDFIQ